MKIETFRKLQMGALEKIKDCLADNMSDFEAGCLTFVEDDTLGTRPHEARRLIVNCLLAKFLGVVVEYTRTSDTGRQERVICYGPGRAYIERGS